MHVLTSVVVVFSQIGDFGLARDLIGCNHYISQGGQIPVKWTSPEVVFTYLAGFFNCFKYPEYAEINLDVIMKQTD